MKQVLTALVFFPLTALFAQNTDSSSYYLKKGLEEKEAKRYQVASQYFKEAIQQDPASAVASTLHGSLTPHAPALAKSGNLAPNSFENSERNLEALSTVQRHLLF